VIDLSPWTPAVPEAVVARISSARRVLAVGHENPDADTIGSTLAVRRLVAACGGLATPVFSDLIPPLYAFVPDIEAARTDPEPGVDYDLLVVSDCAGIDRIGAVAGRHPELFAALPRVVLDHHASNGETGPADWVDPAAAATCEMTALLAARLGVPLDEGGGALAAQLMAGIVMDTATFAHPNATPPDAHASPRRSSTPGRRSPTSRAGSTARSPRPSCGCSGSSWDGSRRRPPDGSSTPRSSTPTS
jgi:phosphoesterase RecJ-like protein